MKYEAEVVSQKFLPAVRCILSEKLSENYGLNQREIASALDVTQAAVSNYLREGRADEEIKSILEEDPQVEVIIEEAVEKAANQKNFSDQISRLLHTVRDKGLMKEEFEDAVSL